jgi:acyl-CoA thioesterase-1
VVVLAASTLAQAASRNIVAIGASNTSGWGVGEASAYPARLEALLREKGYDVRVTNAGVPFQTTVGMHERINPAVPDGTDLVILQPGSNDKRFIVTLASRAANIDAMVKRLTERKIKVIVFDPDFDLIKAAHRRRRFIHLGNEGHAWACCGASVCRMIAAVSTAP